jgi:hypothetical protein
MEGACNYITHDQYVDSSNIRNISALFQYSRITCLFALKTSPNGPIRLEVDADTLASTVTTAGLPNYAPACFSLCQLIGQTAVGQSPIVNAIHTPPQAPPPFCIFPTDLLALYSYSLHSPIHRSLSRHFLNPLHPRCLPSRRKLHWLP